MFPEPLLDIKKEKLFAPQHPGQCLPHYIGRIFPDASRRDRPVELVGLAPAGVDSLIEPPAERFLGTRCDIGQPQPDDCGRPRADA